MYEVVIASAVPDNRVMLVTFPKGSYVYAVVLPNASTSESRRFVPASRLYVVTCSSGFSSARVSVKICPAELNVTRRTLFRGSVTSVWVTLLPSIV